MERSFLDLKDNPYNAMQKRFYDATYEQMKPNHSQHNDNPDYWELLLLGMKNAPEKWKGKIALDFGCGQGRNVINMMESASFERVDGVDISHMNISMAAANLVNSPTKKIGNLYTNNGYDLIEIPGEVYDLITSTITFQHICVHKIRLSLMKEIYRVLKPGGIFSFQMGYGRGHSNTVGYFEDKWDAQGTNSFCDVKIEDDKELIEELEQIGFKDIQTTIRPSRGLDAHTEWIFIKCNK